MTDEELLSRLEELKKPREDYRILKRELRARRKWCCHSREVPWSGCKECEESRTKRALDKVIDAITYGERRTLMKIVQCGTFCAMSGPAPKAVYPSHLHAELSSLNNLPGLPHLINIALVKPPRIVEPHWTLEATPFGIQVRDRMRAGESTTA